MPVGYWETCMWHNILIKKHCIGDCGWCLGASSKCFTDSESNGFSLGVFLAHILYHVFKGDRIWFWIFSVVMSDWRMPFPSVFVLLLNANVFISGYFKGSWWFGYCTPIFRRNFHHDEINASMVIMELLSWFSIPSSGSNWRVWRTVKNGEFSFPNFRILVGACRECDIFSFICKMQAPPHLWFLG